MLRKGGGGMLGGARLRCHEPPHSLCHRLQIHAVPPLVELSMCCWVCIHPRHLRLYASCSQPRCLGMVGAIVAKRGFWVICNESSPLSAQGVPSISALSRQVPFCIILSDAVQRKHRARYAGRCSTSVWPDRGCYL
uniref:Uncharacterized protein n=1 Tax=Setaria viridis TaxID=4556 RepID=A0A4U6TJV1_SETVI|nr:hypothetical protein SEVIR_8G165100v2 [Setaria viridis]